MLLFYFILKLHVGSSFCSKKNLISQGSLYKDHIISHMIEDLSKLLLYI